MAKNEVYKDLDYDLKRQICHGWIGLVWYVEPDSGLFTLEPNQHHSTLNINSFSFRGPEISKESPENLFRIFVVGGSAVFGYGSTSDETTIPGFLQKKIGEAGLDINVEVVNAGIGGSYSFIETLYIKNVLLEFNPDLFIVFDGANDVRYRILDPEIKNKTSIFNFLSKFIDNPFYRTPFMIYHSVPKEWAFSILFQPVSEEVADEVIAGWKKRWLEICELGEKEGFKTLVTVQPMVGTGSRIPTSDEFIEWQGQESFAEISMINTMANLVNELNKCDGTADLTGIFDNVSEPIYFDQVHTTDFGNEIIAKRLFELSLPLIRD